MIRGKLLHSVLTKDGKNYAVDLNSWANLTLQGAELQKFKEDMTQIVAHYEQEIQNNNLIVTPINENITTQSGNVVSFIVGSEFSQTESYIRPAIEIEWYQKMSQDPNIIRFNDREIYT